MKYLVIHDRPPVADIVVQILQTLGAGQHEVLLVEDGASAREALRERLFDLAIVDLTIPHIKGRGEPTYSVAEELLAEVYQTDNLNVPGDVIGLTRDPGAGQVIASEIGPHLMAVIEEDVAGGWQQQLSDRISYTIRAASSRQQSINQHFDYDVAVITALDREFEPYREIFELTPLRRFAGAHEFLFRDKADTIRKGVAFSVGRAGQAPAASASQALITQFRPNLCLMSGFCGGFQGKASVGDVIVAESVFDWDYGKWQGAGDQAVFLSRPDPIGLRGTKADDLARDLVRVPMARHDEILFGAMQRSNNRITSVVIKKGPMASGSAVVNDKNIISRICGLNENLLGVDMEAYGFYHAAAVTPVIRPQFLCIKAVADYCDGTKDEKEQESCSYLSAKVVEEVVRSRWDFA